MKTESNYYLDRLISDLANGKETIIKRNKGQSNLAKAASPAHWRFGLSWNLAPHVGRTGRLTGSEIAQIDSNGGRLSIVTMSLAVTVWPQIAMQIFGTPFPILGKGGRSGSTIVPFDRVMVCSYRLSIVTISLYLMAAICKANSRAQPPFREKGRA